MTKQTDANYKITDWQFDALGRVTSIWQPNRSRALNDAASVVYAYGMTKTAAPWVRTDTLKADGKTYTTLSAVRRPSARGSGRGASPAAVARRTALSCASGNVSA